MNGQPSVYLPVLKQGGEANTIAVVDGVKDVVAKLLDVPKQLVHADVVFDQSVFVAAAIENLIHEGTIGLVLTGLMILIFLGSLRATAAVFLSIPLSALAAFIRLGSGQQHHQRHGSGRAGPGLFPADRQLGRRPGKHFPPPGNGRAARGRRRTRRQGSRPAGAGGDPDHGRCLLSGHLPLRRQPLSVSAPGACRWCSRCSPPISWP